MNRGFSGKMYICYMGKLLICLLILAAVSRPAVAQINPLALTGMTILDGTRAQPAGRHPGRDPSWGGGAGYPGPVRDHRGRQESEFAGGAIQSPGQDREHPKHFPGDKGWEALCKIMGNPEKMETRKNEKGPSRTRGALSINSVLTMGNFPYCLIRYPNSPSDSWSGPAEKYNLPGSMPAEAGGKVSAQRPSMTNV
jgi:hypothetical protein